MTVRSITSEELQMLAFDTGAAIVAGAHAMHLRIGDVEFSARYDDAADGAA